MNPHTSQWLGKLSLRPAQCWEFPVVLVNMSQTLRTRMKKKVLLVGVRVRVRDRVRLVLKPIAYPNPNPYPSPFKTVYGYQKHIEKVLDKIYSSDEHFLSTYSAPGFFFFFLTSLLEYNCFTMLCYLLLYNKVNQLYVYIYPHMPSLLHLPPPLPIPPLPIPPL